MTGNEIDRYIASKIMNGVLRAYSTDIAAAWSVVEKLENLITISGPKAAIGAEQVNGDSWYAEILEAAGTPPIDSISAFAETAPMGICRAAVKLAAIRDRRAR